MTNCQFPMANQARMTQCTNPASVTGHLLGIGTWGLGIAHLLFDLADRRD